MSEMDWTKVLQVGFFEAKPNKMFTEEQRQSIRFLRYSHPVECAECGRRSKSHWTSLLSFQAMDMRGTSIVLRSATGKIHAPLTPVCGSHPLAVAEMPPLPPRKRKKKANAPSHSLRDAETQPEASTQPKVNSKEEN